MSTIRRAIAATIAAGALALGVGFIQASAAPVEPDTAKTVVVAGGGQGGWPMSR